VQINLKKGSGNMSEKQKKILETFKQVLPEMSKEDQNYLLGYGEGMAAALKKIESDGEEDGRIENF
jgi:hypothetical protein